MDYAGLHTVISGGQCGVDRGALDQAYEYGIKTGGTAPKGYRTYKGPAPELKGLGLTESYSDMYDIRTKKNIKDSDATLVIASNLDSPGTRVTIDQCHTLKKKCFNVLLPPESQNQEILKYYSNDYIFQIADFITGNHVEILNVAGNRDRGQSDYHYRSSKSVMLLIFEALMIDHKLISSL